MRQQSRRDASVARRAAQRGGGNEKLPQATLPICSSATTRTPCTMAALARLPAGAAARATTVPSHAAHQRPSGSPWRQRTRQWQRVQAAGEELGSSSACADTAEPSASLVQQTLHNLDALLGEAATSSAAPGAPAPAVAPSAAEEVPAAVSFSRAWQAAQHHATPCSVADRDCTVPRSACIAVGAPVGRGGQQAAGPRAAPPRLGCSADRGCGRTGRPGAARGTLPRAVRGVRGPLP